MSRRDDLRRALRSDLDELREQYGSSKNEIGAALERAHDLAKDKVERAADIIPWWVFWAGAALGAGAVALLWAWIGR